MAQLLANKPEIPLQVFVIANKVERQVPKGVREKIHLCGEMQLPVDRFRVQPATNRIVEVAVVSGLMATDVSGNNGRHRKHEIFMAVPAVVAHP